MNTAQEREWAGRFGDEYNRRSPGDEIANVAFFRTVLDLGIRRRTAHAQVVPKSIVELGAGQGANLRALARLLPEAQASAVEINPQACEVLAATAPCSEIFQCSILDWQPDRTWDLAFTKGVLIHVNPDHLGMAYETIHRAAGRWILIAEYYSPTPVSVPYRDHDDLLWKRDFAGELLDKYKDLRCLDYGFAWKRDTAQDDLTWFLLEKTP